MIADLTTATPVEIDTEAARLDNELRTLRAAYTSAVNAARRHAGERPIKTTRDGVKTWATTDEQARDAANAILDNPGTRTAYEIGQIAAVVARITETSAALAANHAAAAAIQTEYDRRPWTRYVTVPGGHIHSGIWCAGGTIRPTTLRGWTPELSGKDVADAVKQLGSLLCTHCFPSAPVEWTIGVKADAPASCAGSGTSADRKTFRRQGATGYAFCPECKTNVTTTTYGYLRKHKAATA